ncbi:hypothetical protein NDU88_000933 [Pleurodeles waltl]|uniref:Uncharacterized protein n=1 Tax=Pleurodeles waltl TaxID=8319 RepID=A0AAV7THQ3_PLEWA|nr:hypothetical protein NDU88_000933 [Pleurodeles waltl]
MRSPDTEATIAAAEGWRRLCGFAIPPGLSRQRKQPRVLQIQGLSGQSLAPGSSDGSGTIPDDNSSSRNGKTPKWSDSDPTDPRSQLAGIPGSNPRLLPRDTERSEVALPANPHP